MLLHNFIIDKREDRALDPSSFHIDVTDSRQQALTLASGETPRPLVSDNNEPRVGGRRSLCDEELRSLAIATRHRITVDLATRDMKRPLHHDMKYNQYGHIYMTS